MRTNFSFLLVLLNLLSKKKKKIAKERKYVCNSRVTCQPVTGSGCVKSLWLLGFSHLVCSEEVQDMFYVFYIKLNKTQNPDVFDLTLSYQCPPANKHFLSPLPADT